MAINTILQTLWHLPVNNFTLGKLIMGLGIILGFIILRRLLAKRLLNAIKHYVEKKQSTLINPKFIEALEVPVQLLPISLGLFLALSYLQPVGMLKWVGTNINQTLVMLALFAGLYNLIGPVGNFIIKLNFKLTDAMVNFFVKVIKVFLVFVAGATVVEAWGVKVAPILASFGLFGMAIVFAAQDLFKNLIAGFLIIAEKRFNKGDKILVDGVVEGFVEQLGFRSTLIRRMDRVPVYVPNTELSDSAVVNFNAMTFRRIKTFVTLEYNTTNEQIYNIRQQIEDYILGDDDFAKPHQVPTHVRVHELADSSIDILVYCFTKTIKWNEWLVINEKLLMKIKDIVEQNGAEMAYPTQSLHIEKMPSREGHPTKTTINDVLEEYR